MKQLKTLLGLNLILFLSLCLLGCQSTPNQTENAQIAETEPVLQPADVYEKPEGAIIWASKDGIAFDLSNFGDDKEAINIVILSKDTTNSASIYGPVKDFVYPYVEAANTYDVKIYENKQLKGSKEIIATAGLGELYIKSEFTYDDATKNVHLKCETDSKAELDRLVPFVYAGDKNTGVDYFQTINNFDIEQREFNISLYDLISSYEYSAVTLLNQFADTVGLSEISFHIIMSKYANMKGATGVVVQDSASLSALGKCKFSKTNFISNTKNGIQFDITKVRTTAKELTVEIRGNTASGHNSVLYTIPFISMPQADFEFPFVTADTIYKFTVKNNSKMVLYEETIVATSGQGHKTCEFNISYDNANKELLFEPAKSSTKDMLVYLYFDSPELKSYEVVMYSQNQDSFYPIVNGANKTSIKLNACYLTDGNPLDSLLEYIMYVRQTDETSFTFLPTFAFIYNGLSVTTTNFDATINNGNYFVYTK